MVAIFSVPVNDFRASTGASVLPKEKARIAAGFSVLPAAVSTAAEAKANARTTIAIPAVVGSRGVVPVAVTVIGPIITVAVMSVAMTIAVVSVAMTIAVVTATRANV